MLFNFIKNMWDKHMEAYAIQRKHKTLQNTVPYYKVFSFK